MPDVSRSDSTRSDASRPRVSFNRNVHVKRINAPNTANAYSLSSDGTSLVPTSIRRERPLTKKEITKEAEVVLKQVDKVSCTATANVKLDDKPKPKKKRRETFSFLKRNEKPEKVKNSSSDIDSGSSEEYRIYRVNATMGNKKSDDDDDDGDDDVDANGECSGNRLEEQKKHVKNKKNYDFMSLDRKRLKKQRKKESLDYLSLEKNNEALEKMKKAKSNRTLISVVFDKVEGKAKKLTSPQTGAAVVMPDAKDNWKTSANYSADAEDEKHFRKSNSRTVENVGALHFAKKKEHNVEKIVRKLTDMKTPTKLMVNTGYLGIKEPQNDFCHNENRPFSYTNGDKNDIELNLIPSNAEDLVDSTEELKSTSPTSDVIYAQVIVGGRGGNTEKATVNERVASNEVGRVFVGEDLNQSQVGINYKINPKQNGGVCEIVTVNSDEILKKEKFDTSNMSELYRENHEDSYYRKNSESDRASTSPTRDGYTKIVKITSPQDSSKCGDKPSDLHDLSIRREILLSRSESQAKERFNSLKRLQEPARVKRHVSVSNGVRHSDKPSRNGNRYLGDDIRPNENLEVNLRKKTKEPEFTEPPVGKKREQKVEAPPKDQEEIWKNSDKIHVIKTDDDDNILRKLSRMGKSKSFIQDKTKSKRMEKMKMLFKKKKEGKSSESEDDPLSARYIEYRGSDVELSDRSTDSSPRRFKPESTSKISHSRRMQIPTSVSYDSTGTLTKIKNNKNKDPKWFQSLHKRDKNILQKKFIDVSPDVVNYPKSTNLRFFGDTDQESTINEPNPPDVKVPPRFHQSEKITDSEEDQSIGPSRPDSRMTSSTIKGSSTGKHKSKYDLDKPDYGVKQMNHGLNLTSNKFDDYPSYLNEPSATKTETYNLNGVKYGPPRVNRSASTLTNSTKYGTKEKLRNLKSTPASTSASSPNESLSRRVMSHGNLYSQEDKPGGRRRIYDSSAESATEGDSSQNSSKSMIYLHAATVGDIPGPRNIYKSERRSDSREELSSIGDNGIIPSANSPGKKTLSRSISVLAPWRPKHNKEERAIHYDTMDYNKGKPPTGIGKNRRSSSRERKTNELRFNTIGKENRRRKDLLR